MPSRSIAFLCVVFVACVPDAPPPLFDGGTKPETDAGVVNVAGDFCRELIAAQVALAARCGTLSDAGVADAVAYAQRTCAQWPLPRRVFVESAAPACLALYENATCTTVIDPAVCDAAMPGVAVANDACFTSSDCVSGLFCDPSATCPGVCKARVAIGQPASFDEHCVPEGYVDNGVCTARKAIGDFCNAGSGSRRQQCVKGGFCSTGALCVAESRGALGDDCGVVLPPCGEGSWCSQRCLAYRHLGESCGFFDGRCQTDLTCVQDVCVKPGSLGDECTFTRPCRATLTCERANGGLVGACRVPRAVGEACTGEDGCEATAFCHDGLCTKRSGEGGACEYDDDCKANHRCTMNVCARLGSLGAACLAGNHCLSGTCIASKCTAASFCVEP